MFRKFFTLIGTVGIIVGFVVLIQIMGAMRPELEREEVVETTPVVFYQVAQSKSVTLDVEAQGEVRPRTDITLTTQISGKIVSTSDKFVDGGAFEKGDLLVKIEDADYRAAVASANARVAQASQALKQEEAEAALALQDFEELDREGEANDLTLRKPQLAQARANYQAARADYNSADLNLKRTEIRAPFKGRVRTRLAGEGQFIGPGAQIGRIFSVDQAEIILPLTDNDLAKLGIPIAFNETEDEPGPTAKLTAVVAGRNHQWEGRIARTGGAIDPTTRQISAIAVVDDPYGAGANNGTPLAIGLFVTAKIKGQIFDNAIILPRSALYGRNTVYAINADNQLVERKVSIVSSDRDNIVVAAGVIPGERIATSPLRGAGDGDIVDPTDPLSDPADTPRSDEAIDNVAEAISTSGAAQ